MKRLKRIVAIHDISGVGKCSLTVALPIISAAGIETSVLPTAVLSTHTGGFKNFTYRDLTKDITSITTHWKSLNITFDAIYTGFLGSFKQLDLMIEFFKTFKTDNNIILVDPVMADNGKLYKTFTPKFVKGMHQLCKKADVIVPNITEAAFLTKEEYKHGPYTKEYIERILKNLNTLGPKKIVLTGVFFKEEELGVATYNASSGKITYTLEKRIPGYFHGTGDIFSSALLSGLLNGFSLAVSASIATRFTVAAIQKTAVSKTDVRFGVNFEQGIPEFLKELKLI
ncbi:MAG: pyridoxamine kinase [Candidatus Azobacteroides pseudotrichonymphae]|nr:MAG: pyridoxamine kinase [Candidatus Azobacteroides pseudotrichonymphae]